MMEFPDSCRVTFFRELIELKAHLVSF
jgi:hypothetical protein